MESQTTTSSESKQITIDVPADRLAEFYAFFGRFLAGGGPGGGRRGRHGPPAGGPAHREHRCGHHREQAQPGSETDAPTPPEAISL